MNLFLFLLNIFGVALLASKIFNRQVGLLAALLFATSFWSQSLISSGEIRIFLMTIFLTYGLWLVLKIRPKSALCFLIFASLLTFLILYPDLSFWLKHGFSSSPTFVPIIHDYINRCHQAFPIPVCRLIYNKPAFFTQEYLLNFLSHFSTDSLFIASGRGNLFLAPFFYLGLFSILLYWRKHLLLTTWIALYPLTASFTGGFDYFHSVLGLALLPIISALGISQAIKFVVGKKQK